MLEAGLKCLIAYGLGGLLGSLVLGRFRGVDIRRLGSGNAGATNALRTQGKAFGFSVLVFDVLKGVIAVRVLPSLFIPGVPSDPAVSPQWLLLACGLAVIAGHVYPLWYGFRGGKGVATIAGVIGALEPRLLFPLIGCWLTVLLLTGYVGLASMLAGVGLVVVVLWWAPGNASLLIFCISITALVIFTHRGNIARMVAGTEHRARRLWLFRPRAA